jgi:sugar fermentation stimulation protein A
MPFPPPLVKATFLGRPQRFLAQMAFPDGSKTLAYCANPGSLHGCLRSGSAALLWDSEDPTRKRRYTWRAVKLPEGWVGTDTHLANRLVTRLLQQRLLAGFEGYEIAETESRLQKGLRLDFLLTGSKGNCFLEVKNSVVVENGIARFPDSVTPRGLKHLTALTRRATQGQRAALLFVVQRGDAERFRISNVSDPAYARGVEKALAAGVELLALAVDVSPRGFNKPRLLKIS